MLQHFENQKIRSKDYEIYIFHSSHYFFTGLQPQVVWVHVHAWRVIKRGVYLPVHVSSYTVEYMKTGFSFSDVLYSLELCL